MAMGKTIEPSNWKILLPEAMIQDVQSRLSRKEAAQTTVLSKSWHMAWLTRPDIDLDSLDTQRNDGAEDTDHLIPDRFAELARKTLRRSSNAIDFATQSAGIREPRPTDYP